MRLQAPQEAAALPATRWMATTRAFFRQGGSTLALCPMVWVHVFLLMKYGHTGNGRRGIRQQVFLTCFSPKLSICCFIASLILQHVRHRFSDTSESLVLVDTSLQLFSKSYATIDPRPNHRSRKRKPKACSAVKERKKALLTLHCCVTESSEVKVLLK